MGISYWLKMLLLLCLLVWLPGQSFGAANSHMLELTAAASARQWEDDDARTGLGVRSRYSYFPKASGLGFIGILNVEHHKRLPGAVFGGGWRFSGKNTFFDLAAGITAGIYSYNPALIPSFGYNIAKNIYFTIPIYYNLFDGFWSRISYAPYLGIRF